MEIERNKLDIVYILFFTFLLRVIPKLTLNTSISSDAYFHLYLKNEIRQQKNIPTHLKRITLNNELNYPFGFHWFLSFIPKKYDSKIDTFSSAILDSIYVFFVYQFTLLLTEINEIAIISSVFVSISSILLRVSNGPRAYNVTPRVFGELLTLIYLFGMISFQLHGNLLWFCLSTLFVPLIILSSKFSVQAILFFSIFLAIFGNFYLLAANIIGFFIGRIIFGKIIFKIIKAHYMHSIFYFKYNQKNYLWPSILSYSKYIKIFKRKWNEKKFIVWVYQENSLLHQIFFFHWPILVILFFYAYYEMTYLQNQLVLYIIISFIIAFLVNYKYLLFLGEPERYIEYTILMQAILFSIIIVNNNMYFLFYIYLFQSIVGYFCYIIIYKQYNKNRDVLFYDIRNINEQIDNDKTTVLPIGGVHWLLLYNSIKVSLVMVLQNNEKIYSYEKWKMILGNYPFPGIKIEQLNKEICFDYILIEKNKLAQYEKKLKDDLFHTSKVKLIYAGKALHLYKLTGEDE